jgi:predicted short-subunit dehydrogenase-like oxidoreductase (DUF2520 family)
MRQVPHYLLIGNGRVARHFQQYFSLLQLPFQIWHRSESLTVLREHIQSSSHILLLISDRAIEEFAAQELQNTQAVLIHFSGALVSNHIIGAHPLCTFNENLYSLEQYQRISFIIDHDAPEFTSLFPALPNTHVRLHKSLKPKYHALCVLSGNFSCLLWQKFFNSLENEFNIPHTVALPYLQQLTQNLCEQPAGALTGPLARGDKGTIAENLTALHADPYQEIYKSFVACFEQIKNKKEGA